MQFVIGPETSVSITIWAEAANADGILVVCLYRVYCFLQYNIRNTLTATNVSGFLVFLSVACAEITFTGVF